MVASAAWTSGWHPDPVTEAVAPAAQRQPRGGPEAAQAQRSIAAQSPRGPGRQPVSGSHGDPPHHPHPRQRHDHHRRPQLCLEGSCSDGA